MCGEHGYTKTAKETQTRHIIQQKPEIVGTKTDEISKNLGNDIDHFLNNPGQKNHYERLRTKEDKFIYISKIITEHYAMKMSKATAQEVNTLQQEMGKYLTTASQKLFGNNPAQA